MWEHYCKIEQTLMQIGDGEECNWCGLTEATDPVVIGDTKELLQWLRQKIHNHGERYDAKDLCKIVTGEELNFKYFMDYAKNKYSKIYNLD